MITYKCGKGPCTDFTTTIVKQAKEDTNKEEKVSQPFSKKDFEMPFNLNPETSITAPIQKAVEDTTQDITQDISDKASKAISDKATSALTGAITGALSPSKTKSEETSESKEQEKEEQPPSNIKVGGRILHSRKRKQQIIA
jgi:hypothetical protein